MNYIFSADSVASLKLLYYYYCSSCCYYCSVVIAVAAVDDVATLFVGSSF